MIDYDALEAWASNAAEALRGVIDACVESSPDTPSDQVCTDLRRLLSDLDRILSGGSSLMTKMMTVSKDGGSLKFLSKEKEG